MLLLSLQVLILAGLSLLLWIVYQIWVRMEQTTRTIVAIQRILNAFDRPETLAQSGVEAGHSFLVTDQEISSVEKRLQSESRQRAGSIRSRRTSPVGTG